MPKKPLLEKVEHPISVFITGLTLEISNFEDARARLRGCSLKFWAMNLCEASGAQEGREQISNGGL